MDDPVVEALIVDLLAWLSARERSYEETMAAWRTSCPRLPVWEDANDLGLVRLENAGGGSVVRVTPAGSELLRARRHMLMGCELEFRLPSATPHEKIQRDSSTP